MNNKFFIQQLHTHNNILINNEEIWNLSADTHHVIFVSQQKQRIVSFLEEYVFTFTLKMCTLLNIENNLSWVNFIHFLEKSHLLTIDLIFISSNWRIHRYIKFDIHNKRLEWCKNRFLFTKWATEIDSDNQQLHSQNEKVKTFLLELI